MIRRRNLITIKPLPDPKTREIKEPKFEIIQYNQPRNNDLAIMIAFFNPAKSIRIQQNLLLVKHYFDLANIPYFIAELAFNNDKFILNKSDNILQLRSNSYIFYKENLINLLEKIIPNQFTKLCIMDCDIMFENPNWYDYISGLLNKSKICQPFKTAIWLNESFRHSKSMTSFLYTKDRSGHPGFMWAFDRKWFQTNKLPDFGVIGGADTIFSFVFMKNASIQSLNSYFTKSYTKYKNNITDINFTITGDLNIYHLFHGTPVNRQYLSRHELLIKEIKKYNYDDISYLIEYDNNGLIHWKKEVKDNMNKVMLTYFKNRSDDDV